MDGDVAQLGAAATGESMSRYRICAQCGEKNDRNAKECGKCAVLFSESSRIEPKRDGRHEASPNDCLCACGCGQKATMFPGTIRGGATHGYASGHWMKFDPKDDPQTVVPAQAIEHIKSILGRR